MKSGCFEFDVKTDVFEQSFRNRRKNGVFVRQLMFVVVFVVYDFCVCFDFCCFLAVDGLLDALVGCWFGYVCR